MNGTYTGVVDRIEDSDTAVILIEQTDEVVEQFDVPVDWLPDPAQAEGAVISVTLEDGEFVTAEFRPDETSAWSPTGRVWTG